MWMANFLRGDHLQGWHCVHSAEALDHWVTHGPDCLADWQNELAPGLRDVVTHVGTYVISDHEIEFIKSQCDELF